MEAKKRISYPLGMFDLVKGLGMISIILTHNTSHIDISPWLFVLIRSGAGLMGTYYAINAFSFRPMPIKASAKKYAKTYLSPYFRLAVMVLIGLVLTHHPVRDFLNYILAFALGNLYEKQIGAISLSSISMAWFFLTLFWGSILLNLVLKISNKYLRLVCLITVAAIGISLEYMRLDYFCICRAFQALPTMYLGYHVYTQNLLDRNGSMIKKAVPYLLFVATIPVGIFDIKYNDSEYLALWVRFFCEVIWGYAAICFARDTVSYANAPLELIRKIGRYSYWVIIAHTLEIICFPWERFPFYLFNNPDVGFLALSIFRGIIILLGCILLQKIDKLERQYRRKKKHAHRK